MNEPTVVDQTDLHADKYNDPRVRITKRGIAILVAIVVVATAAALLSVRARATHLEKTRQFWGADGITAMQLGDRVTLIARGAPETDAVDLTGMPGLGHLRRALLDERHYDWNLQSLGPVSETCSPEVPQEKAKAQCVQLRFADPTLKRVPELRIDMQLDDGWVGPADGTHRAKLNERVQPAMKHQIGLLMNFRQQSYDERK